MKIAVFGYYNSLNAGDDRIQYCITRLLEGNTIVFLPHYLPPPKEYLETFDWIVIGGGGLVFERVGVWADVHKWLKHCKAKIGFLGLGVNRVTEDLEIELSRLLEAAEFFYVRDDQSKELLHHHPKVEVHPDLTWCFPFNSNWEEGQEGVALNLLPCHWKEFNHDAWIEKLKDQVKDQEIHPFPFHFGKKRDYDLLRHYFSEKIPFEFSLKPLAKSKFLVGCRYHAITFSMQIGKPFIAINYDEKVKRLLEESDLLECCLETTEFARLPEKMQFVLDNEAALKQKINAFASSQIERAAKLKEAVQGQILSHQPQTPVSFTASVKSAVKRYVRN